MDGEADGKQLGDYFVVCGLPKNPKPYDLSPVLSDLEEILIPEVFEKRTGSDIHNLPVDFTHFPEPIVDIQLINPNDDDPEGYTVLRKSYGRTGNARILSGIKREYVLCYRRGRDIPPITSISFFTASSSLPCPPNSHKLLTTFGHEDADLGGIMEPRTYLMYTRASTNFGIDELVVTDIVVVLKSKGEVCPPAYHELPRTLNGNKIGHEPYLCYRKSLVKEHTIAYEPQVLKWYHFPSLSQSLDGNTGGQKEVTGSCIGATSVSSPFECTHSNTSDADGGSYLHPDICQVANFCLPWGAAIESWSVEQNPPHTNFFSFVLTNEAYQRLFGVAFTFHEPYDLRDMDRDKCYRLGVDPELVFVTPDSSVAASPQSTAAETLVQEKQIAERQRHFIHSRVGDRVIGVTKTICLLSRWSFSVAYTNLLGFLYSRCFLQPAARQDDLSDQFIPIERYLEYFLCEVPFPDLRMPSVRVQFSATPILLQRQNETSASSSSCECFFHLLDILGVQLSIQLLLYMLTEQKVVITSVQPYRLAQLGEALTSMIFPLHWTVVYIPFIYMGCIHVIQSPSPFLIGVDTRFCDFFRLPQESGVTYVDVDNRNIISGQPQFTEKMLPKDCLKKLEMSLNTLDGEIRSYRSKRPAKLSQASINVILERMFFADESQPLEESAIALQREWFEEVDLMTRIGARIKATFREFMANLLRNYRKCLVTVVEAEGEELFRAKDFLKQHTDKHTRPFYQAMLDTQQWANFIRDCSYLSPRYDELAEFNSLLDHHHQQQHHHHQQQQQQHHYHQAASSSSLLGLAGESNGYSLGSDHSGGSTGSASHLRSLTLATSGSGSGGSELSAACTTAFQLTTSSQDLFLRPTRVIGPPTWPLSGLADLPIAPPSADDRPSFSINIHLLHRLVTAALRSTPPLSTSTSEVSATSTGTGKLCHRSNGRLEQVDGMSTPASLLAAIVCTRGSEVGSPETGLTGLPTEFTLPVRNTVLLRRTPRELRQSHDFAVQCIAAALEEHQLGWIGYLVSSMYALWFTMLPSYLASVYAIDARLSLEGSGAASHGLSQQEVHQHAVQAMNGELVKAVGVMQRLVGSTSSKDYVFIDQVCMRILLVLVYQNRPGNKYLRELLNERWTPCSACVFNHIYKAYQKEMQTAESAYQLPRRGQNDRQNVKPTSRPCRLQQMPAPTVPQESLSTGDVQLDPSMVTVNSDDGKATLTVSSEEVRDSVDGQPQPALSTNGAAASQSVTARRTGDETGGSGPDEWAASAAVAADKRGAGVGEDSEPPQIPSGKVDGDTCWTPLRRAAPLASADELTGFTGSATSTPLPVERSPVSSRSSSSSSSSLLTGSDRRASAVDPAHGQPTDGQRSAVPNSPQPDCPAAQSQPAVVARPTLRLEDLPPRPLPIKSMTTGDALAMTNAGQGVGSQGNREQGMMTGDRLRQTPDGLQQENPPSLSETLDNHRPSVDFSRPSDTPIQTPNQNTPTESPRSSWTSRLSSFHRSTSDFLKRKLRDVVSPSAPSSVHPLRQQHHRQQQTGGSPSFAYTPWTPQPQRLSHRSSIFGVDSTDDAALGGHAGDRHPPSLALGGATSSRMPRDMSRWSRRLEAKPGPPVGPNGYPGENDNCGPASNHLRRGSEVIPLSPSMNSQQARREAAASPRWYTIAGPMAVGKPTDQLCPSNLSWLLRNRRQTARDPAVVHPKSHLLVGGAYVILRLRVVMTTCSRCPECRNWMFDEEIMASWPPTKLVPLGDDMPRESYTIACRVCSHQFMPLLTVYISGEVTEEAARRLTCPDQTAQQPGGPTPQRDTSSTTPVSTGEGAANSSGEPTTPQACATPETSRSTSGSPSKRPIPLLPIHLCEFQHPYLSPVLLRRDLEQTLQTEGDSFFRPTADAVQDASGRRVSSASAPFHRQPVLTWNLIWCFHRLGLPTHLLDVLTAWLVEKQADFRESLTSGAWCPAAPGPFFEETHGCWNLQPMLQVDFCSGRPSVRVSSSWVTLAFNQPMLYQQFWRWLKEYKFPIMLVPHGQRVNPGSLGLHRDSFCPVEAAIAAVIDDYECGQLDNALRTLVMLRVQAQNHGAEVKHRAHTEQQHRVSARSQRPADSPVREQSEPRRDLVAQPPPGHTCSWTLNTNLYRELVFLILAVQHSRAFDFDTFDEKYSIVYERMLRDGSSLGPTDRSPDRLAARCRSLLRRLTLV